MSEPFFNSTLATAASAQLHETRIDYRPHLAVKRHLDGTKPAFPRATFIVPVFAPSGAIKSLRVSGTSLPPVLTWTPEIDRSTGRTVITGYRLEITEDAALAGWRLVADEYGDDAEGFATFCAWYEWAMDRSTRRAWREQGGREVGGAPPADTSTRELPVQCLPPRIRALREAEHVMPVNPALAMIGGAQ